LASAIFVVSGEAEFGTTYKLALTADAPQLHNVNEVIAVLPLLVKALPMVVVTLYV
jgi:hypothetical protein